MADVAASIISTCLRPLFQDACQGAELQLRSICGLGKEVVKLESKMSDIEEAVSNAEVVHLQAILDAILDPQRKGQEETNVRKWLHKIKNVYYEVDNLLDKWKTAKLILEIENSHASQRVCCIIPSFRLNWLSLQREIAFSIRSVTENVETFKEEFGRRRPNPDSLRNAIEFLKPETTSTWDLSTLYGRNNEKESLVSKLLHGSSQEGKWLGDVIPIVGMGGIGKTALAQLAFYDEAVEIYFNKRIWVSVPYTFDLMKIAKVIYEAVEEKAPVCAALDRLLLEIGKAVTGVKLLLVLDDIWTVEDRKWNQLKETLKNSHAGSRVLVTTQKCDVAQKMKAYDDPMIHLDLLSDNDCWSILRPLASEAYKEMNDQLDEIREKFVCKCSGLPLVANVLEFGMRSENPGRQWEKVLQSELGNAPSPVFVPFLLNYYDLDSLQKRCFSQCSVLPRNYEIERDELIELWLSFKRSVNLPEDLEEGLRCFDVLAKRNLFRDFTKDYKGDIIKCKMHDIMCEFTRFLIQPDPVDQSRSQANDEAHQFTLLLEASEVQIPASMANKRNMRTLFVLRQEAPNSPEPLSCDVLANLTCLRTLHLRLCNIERLPEDIHRLIHLRYLNLSGNSLRELPNSFCNLFNLLTLRMKECRQLQRLPEEIGKLENLWHLYIEGCDTLEELPKGIGKLKRLQTLDMFVVRKNLESEALKLEDLNGLGHLQGQVNIFRCGNLKDDDLSQGSLLVCNDNRRDYVDLKLNFDGSSNNRNIDDEQTILVALKPHSGLMSLEIRGCRAGITVYPSWMDSLCSLKRVVLGGCRYWESLPPLGKLPALESLQLDDMPSVQKVGLEFLAIPRNNSDVVSFPRLKELHFSRMPNWTTWEEEDNNSIKIMESLASLQISSCDCLDALPGFLRRMTRLQNLTITNCSVLKQRYQGQDWNMISCIPNIQIDGQRIRPPSVA